MPYKNQLKIKLDDFEKIVTLGGILRIQKALIMKENIDIFGFIKFISL